MVPITGLFSKMVSYTNSLASQVALMEDITDIATPNINITAGKTAFSNIIIFIPTRSPNGKSLGLIPLLTPMPLCRSFYTPYRAFARSFACHHSGVLKIGTDPTGTKYTLLGQSLFFLSASLNIKKGDSPRLRAIDALGTVPIFEWDRVPFTSLWTHWDSPYRKFYFFAASSSFDNLTVKPSSMVLRLSSNTFLFGSMYLARYLASSCRM